MFQSGGTIFHQGEESAPLSITFFGGEDISMLDGPKEAQNVSSALWGILSDCF
jgi:hypothetical protein